MKQRSIYLSTKQKDWKKNLTKKSHCVQNNTKRVRECKWATLSPHRAISSTEKSDNFIFFCSNPHQVSPRSRSHNKTLFLPNQYLKKFSSREVNLGGSPGLWRRRSRKKMELNLARRLIISLPARASARECFCLFVFWPRPKVHQTMR
jgi:hypothetical protein